ncbi:zinc finger, CCHC-type containing protein [Tanacetum coccineum]
MLETRALGLCLLGQTWTHTTHGEFRLLMTTSVGNNSVFRSFFEKQKLTGPNFIDWYRQLRLVLSTEDKELLHEHPIAAAPGHGKLLCTPVVWTMDLDLQRNLAHLGAYESLWELKSYVFPNQAEQELLQTVRDFHTCKQRGRIAAKRSKDANPALHAIRGRKGSEKPKRINRNKLVEEVKDFLQLPKKDKKQGRICHECGENGHWRRKCHGASSRVDGKRSAILRELALSVSKDNLVYFMAVPRDGIFEIGDIVFKKRIEKLQHDGLLNSIDIESLGKCVSCLSGKMARKPYSHQVERAKDLLGSKYTPMTVARFSNMVPSKKVDKTPYEIWHGQAPKLSYLRVWGCGSVEDLEEIQEEDTNPSVDTSLKS